MMGSFEFGELDKSVSDAALEVASPRYGVDAAEPSVSLSDVFFFCHFSTLLLGACSE